MQIGSVLSRRKVTGRLYIADLATPTQFFDMGNVVLTKEEPKITRAQMKTAMKGYTMVTHEEPGEVDWRWSMTLDEHANALLALKALSAAPTTVTQEANVGADWSVSSASPGYSYYVGGVGLTAFTMATYTLNTDYTIDLGSGMLTILATGTIAASTALSGTLTSPALVFSQTVVLSRTFWPVQVRLHTFDQNTLIPRDIYLFAGEVAVTDWGQHDGSKWNETKVELLATSAPTVQSVEITASQNA
jgi:hypothetical protein